MLKVVFNGRLLLISLIFSCGANAAEIERVSLSSTGTQANMQSVLPVLSSDGQLVAFESQASNLTDNDVNQNASDIFLMDRASGTLEFISVNSNETQADKTSGAPAITPDGRYVAFHSQAENLIAVDINTSAHDIYIRDRQLGTTEVVSIDSTGQQQPGESLRPAISNDAQIIAFETMSAFDPADTNNNWDIYVHDRQSNTTQRISQGHNGSNGNGKSIQATVSGDGRYVVYESTATNLVVEGASATWHVYLHDRNTGTTQKIVWGTNAKISNNGCCIVYRGLNFSTWKWDIFHYTIDTQQTEVVSQSSDGTPANSNSDQLNVSGDGQHVVFTSAATNLVAGDTNNQIDTFIRNRTEGTTIRMSTNQLNEEGNHNSLSIPAINTTGNEVAFSSLASNLVNNDNNSAADIFVGTIPMSGNSTSVFWMEMVGVEDDGYSLTKTTDIGWGNSGAASLRMISGDGAVEFTTTSTSFLYIVGLSTDNGSASYNTIDYAFYVHADRYLRVFENGANLGSKGRYEFGDVLRIERIGSTIYYKNNDVIVYTSTIPSSEPLLVDVSLYGAGDSIVDVKLIGDSYENFDRDGQPDVWELNYGLNPTDASDALIDSDADGLTNVEEYENGTNPLVWDTDGDGMPDEWELIHELNPLDAADGSEDPDGDGLNNYGEFLQGSEPIYPYVTWVDQVGVGYEPHTLTKIVTGSWNAGAASLQMIPGDGAVEFTTRSTDFLYIVGLSTDNGSASYDTIDYAFYVHADRYLRVFENGVNLGSQGRFEFGDVLRIERIGSTIYYKNNDVIVYTSTTPSSEPLLVDVSLYSEGDSIIDLKLIGNSYEDFDRDGQADDWELTYGLSPADASDALIDSDADGLTNVEEYENGTNPLVWDTDGDGMPDGWEVLHALNPLDGADALQDRDGDGINNLDEYLNGIGSVQSSVTWVEGIGVDINANSITKVIGGAWTAGAASLQMISADGSVAYQPLVADDTMVGLSMDNNSESYEEIDYAIHADYGHLSVFENGGSKGSFGTHQTGDVLQVERVGSTVNYKKNGVIFYTSAIPSSGALLVDTSLANTGAVISGAIIKGVTFDDANRDGLPD